MTQQVFAGIPYDNRMAGKLKHFDSRYDCHRCYELFGKVALVASIGFKVLRGAKRPRIVPLFVRETAHEGLLTDDLRTVLKVIQALPELNRTLDKSPRALRTMHGEGWYTQMGSFASTAFTTENAIVPLPTE